MVKISRHASHKIVYTSTPLLKVLDPPLVSVCIYKINQYWSISSYCINYKISKLWNFSSTPLRTEVTLLKVYDMCIHAVLNLCVVTGSMVASICWNDGANMLAAMQDGNFVVWYHPGIVHADKNLLPLTVQTKEGRCVGLHSINLTGRQLMSLL